LMRKKGGGRGEPPRDRLCGLPLATAAIPQRWRRWWPGEHWLTKVLARH
jgi:hypothetical protein